MNATELRLGNYVGSTRKEDYEPFKTWIGGEQVEKINSYFIVNGYNQAYRAKDPVKNEDGEEYWTQEKYYYLIVLGDDYGYYHLESTNFKPIPLTEEWLIKFGFEKKGFEEAIMFTNGKYNYFIRQKYFGFSRNNGGLIASNIKYVHQLQNLYFALTGEELTIKQ